MQNNSHSQNVSLFPYATLFLFFVFLIFIFSHLKSIYVTKRYVEVFRSLEKNSILDGLHYENVEIGLTVTKIDKFNFPSFSKSRSFCKVLSKSG